MKEGRVAPAADSLRTSQANLRRMVASLEGWAGAPLCKTDDAGLFVPTETGHVVQAGAVGLLEACRSFQKQLAEIHRRGRMLRIGVHQGLFRSRLLGKALSCLREDGRFRPFPVCLPEGGGIPVLESGEADLLIWTEDAESRRTVSHNLRRFDVHVLAIKGAEGLPMGWKELCHAGFVVSPAISGNCESKIALSCRKVGGKAGERLGSAEFADWRERGGGVPYCLALDEELDLEHFEGSVHPCPDSPTSNVNVTHLLNHPYPFLEDAAKLLVDRFRLPLSQHHGS